MIIAIDQVVQYTSFPQNMLSSYRLKVRNNEQRMFTRKGFWEKTTE